MRHVMTRLLVLVAMLTGCSLDTGDDSAEQPDAAPDAFVLACEDCGGGVCQPGDGWRCANAETVFIPCEAEQVCE
jgi:hypothetical protein